MALVNSSTFNFRNVVQQYLTRYGADCADALSEAITEVSKESVKRLKQSSAAAFGSGEYAAGWTRTLEKGRMRTVATVHGKKPTYSLAHLLENGHVTKNGTHRTFRSTPAHPHIAEVAQWAEDEAVNRTIEKLEAF